MINKRILLNSIAIATLALAIASCSSSHPTYQKRKKKKCNCPTWSEALPSKTSGSKFASHTDGIINDWLPEAFKGN